MTSYQTLNQAELQEALGGNQKMLYTDWRCLLGNPQNKKFPNPYCRKPFVW